MTLATEQSSLLTPSSPIKPINNNQVPWRPPLCSNDKLWAAKLMYTIYAAGQSAILNFMPVYYEHTAHFSKMEIGWLQTLSCICSIVSPPFWGVVADHLHSHRAVHIFTIVTGTFLMYGIQWGTTSFSITTAIVIAANFQTAPAGSLLDHAVLDMIAKYGGEYGKQRLFGAVGYGAGAYVTGLIVMMGGISWAFRISLCLSLASLFVLRQIPALEEHDTKGTGAGLERTPSFYQGMRQLIKQRDVIVLLLVVFLMGLMFGVLSSFLTLHLYNLSNQNAQIIGVAIMCETLSELPAFFYSQRILKYMGTVKVLILSIIGYTLRISYYAVMVNPWTAIAFEFLHGITFGLAWAACTQYIYASAPRGCQGTVMGILNAVQNGLGKGAGTLIGGYCYQHYGPHIMWVVTDMGVPLALLGVVAFAKLQHPKIKVMDEIHVDLIVEEEMVETAELFSPHCATPQPLTTPLWQEVHDHPVHENPV